MNSNPIDFMGLFGRFALLNQMWQHWGIVSTGTAWSAGVTGPQAVIVATAAITVTLPQASKSLGRAYFIKNVFAGGVTVAATGADTIDGSASKSLPHQYNSMLVVCDGVSNWWILAEFPQPL
jgi:hypothetical protein